MPSPRKARARDRQREKAALPKQHGGSIRRVYPDAVRKHNRRNHRRRN